jgi:hypothetical protein
MRLRHLLPALASLVLVACNNERPAAAPAPESEAVRQAAATHSLALEPAALMQLVFPSWSSGGQGAVQQVEVPAASTGAGAGKPVLEQQWVVTRPLYVVRLDDTHATLLTEGVATDGQGKATHCHACPAMAGAYFFERDDKGWRLAGRNHAALVAGVNGELGETRLAPLGDGRHLFTVQWGSCWQGWCGNWLHPVLLAPGKAVALQTVPVSADNDGAKGACAALAGKNGTEKDLPDDDCLQVEGQWKLEDGQLKLHFKGLLRTRDGDKGFKALQRIDEQAAYAFGPEALVLKQGRNPVPGF